jgi:ABC-type transport system substrate-binding protein/tetratricopeptide (TPR) repeat protein
MASIRPLLFSVIAAYLALAASGIAAAKDADPIYLQSPYDEITLDEGNNNAVLKIQPLNLPGRKVPAPADRRGDLEIELIEQAGQRFAVNWGAVVKVRLYEELVLAEAQERVQEGRFDEAYPYFRFLEARKPPVAGLKDAIETCLWTQIGECFKTGRQDEAMALLAELSGRNPQRSGLPKAYEKVSLELAKSRIAEGNHRAARKLLSNLTQRYPETKETSVAEFELAIQAKAGELRTQAKSDLAAGRFREAHEAAARMLETWPAIEGGMQLAADVHQKYPLLSVGVISSLAAAPVKPHGGWAEVRAGRLLGQPLAEARSGASEGEYFSYFGELSRPKGNAARIVLKLKEGLKWQEPPRNLSPQDVVRALRAATTPKTPGYDESFAKVLAGIEIGAEGEVVLEFVHPQPGGEAWLHRSLPGFGPFQLARITPQQVSYLRQATFFADAQAPAADVPPSGAPPSEIIERTYPDSAAAILALRRGEVNMVDRISPWDLRHFRSNEEFTVAPYALPRVSVLLPNPRRPRLANRTMRRAILYAIDRESILRRGLLTGQSIAGCEVVSGPFPQPISKEDLRGTGYDSQVEVRPYDPAVAAVLVAVSLQESPPSAAPPSKSLTLAFPAEAMARTACESISRQLELIGLQISLKEIPAGQTAEDDYDLLYTELEMREPTVDAWRLLGPGGTTGECSSSMLLALRSLEQAQDSKLAALRLQEVHRVAAAELPAIPLWQLVNHFAYHKSVKGVPPRPFMLYQDIEHWQVELRVPSE